MTRTRAGVWLVSAAVAAVLTSAPRPLAASSPLAAALDDITVRGCLERDAAASVPVFKLAAKSAIYRLAAPKDIDLGPHVGRTVDVTGTVTAAATPGRPEAELAVKKLTDISNSCQGS